SEAAEAFAAAVERPHLRVLPLPAALFRFAAYGSESVAWIARRAPRLDLRRARDLAERSYTCDVTPTTRAFDWTAATPLADGARRTFAWYRSVGWA
ncbi:MAG: hypothetical protein WD336_02515, partial [Trueperaceae bacterium]